MDRRALQVIGLARRAGRTVHGARAVRQAAEGRGVKLLVVARDASANAIGRLPSSIRTTVPRVRCGSLATLGRAVGRGRTAMLGITDVELARKVLMALAPNTSETDPGPD